MRNLAFIMGIFLTAEGFAYPELPELLVRQELQHFAFDYRFDEGLEISNHLYFRFDAKTNAPIKSESLHFELSRSEDIKVVTLVLTSQKCPMWKHVRKFEVLGKSLLYEENGEHLASCGRINFLGDGKVLIKNFAMVEECGEGSVGVADLELVKPQDCNVVGSAYLEPLSEDISSLLEAKRQACSNVIPKLYHEAQAKCPNGCELFESRYRHLPIPVSAGDVVGCQWELRGYCR